MKILDGIIDDGWRLIEAVVGRKARWVRDGRRVMAGHPTAGGPAR